MKRIVSMTMSAILALGVVTPALADEKTDMANALAEVKSRVDIPAELTEFSFTRDNNEGGNSYYFNWTGKDNSSNLSISYNDGVITNYNGYNLYGTIRSERDGGAKFGKLTMQEGLEKAQQYAARLNPTLVDQIEITTGQEILRDTNYSFPLKRKINNVIAPFNNGNISIDKNTGELNSYYLSWSKITTIEEPTDVITKQDAQKAWQEKIGLELMYNIKHDYTSNKYSAKLVYVSKNNNIISAKTGEAIDIGSGGVGIYASANGAMKEMQVADGAGFSPAEIAEMDSISDLLSVEQCEQAARSNEYLGISAEQVLVRNNVYRDSGYGNAYVRSLSFQTNAEDSTKYSETQVRLDAKTGAVLSFYSYPVTETGEITMDEAKKIADEAIAGLAGDYAAKVEFNTAASSTSSNPYEEYTTHNLSYRRIENGIPCQSNGITVTVAGKGKLSSYSLNWADVQFPAADGVLSVEQATEKLFENSDFDLKYVADNTVVAKERYVPTMGIESAKIVYDFIEEFAYVDAETGQLLDYNTNEIVKPIAMPYTDVSGHYAEQQINKLASCGIRFDLTEQFMPEQVLTQKDMIALLSNIMYGGITPLSAMRVDEIYSRIRYADILDESEKDPEQQVTRATAVKYIVRALGYRKAAELEGIYKTPYNDVTEDEGYVAIATALNIVNGSPDGNFYPNNEITRAHAAIMLYNYLNQ